ncbi:hypothetical protein LRS37_12915 [Neobacillus sedimentimangrovi]|uniref:Uncharacterized protein n=1 Tax=Neobacillus sedimentimangrovi TaxID=2699460 RepID=A0ABS8QKI9_9BACI|nr:hypothetical protein [Neobacillus sedimentimangrovi]MCD4839751.1 hypothetical protein [Neobacillus sedimentimangrovi]
MAKHRRTLATAFDNYKKGQQQQQTPVAEEKKAEAVEETAATTETVAVQDAPVSSQEALEKALEGKEGNSPLTVLEVAERLEMKYQEKVKKPTVEDTHVRLTFLCRRDLAKRLDKLAKNKRGFKTSFINEALEMLLNAYEQRN